MTLFKQSQRRYFARNIRRELKYLTNKCDYCLQEMYDMCHTNQAELKQIKQGSTKVSLKRYQIIYEKLNMIYADERIRRAL